MPQVFAGVTLAGLLQGVVVGAVIGAAVGGISAAISGGDIGKGILFGAVGGAVGGALFYGAGVVIGNLSAGGAATAGATVTSPSGVVIPASAHGGAISQAPAGIIEGTRSAAGAAAGGGGSNWLGDVWKDIDVDIGEGLGQAAVAGGIQSAATIYSQKKAAEAALKRDDLQWKRDKEAADIAQKNALELIAARGEGGGSLPSYRPVEEELRLIKAEEEAVLAKTSAEHDAAEALKQQEFDRIDADREIQTAAATALKTTGRTPSRSEEDLVALQNRARAPEEEIDASVVPPVRYAV